MTRNDMPLPLSGYRLGKPTRDGTYPLIKETPMPITEDLHRAELAAYVRHHAALAAAVVAHNQGLDLTPYVSAVEATRTMWHQAQAQLEAAR